MAYNPSPSSSTLTVTPYDEFGKALAPQSVPISGQGKYVGSAANLDLPDGTAWLEIEATNPITGFELFGTRNGKQLAGYTGVGISRTEGVFAKLEKDGWTGIAFVNIGDSTATVELNAYDDSGALLATKVLAVPTHAKVVDVPQAIFGNKDISAATYIAYSSDKDVVGFQLDGSTDGRMLDALPGM